MAAAPLSVIAVVTAIFGHGSHSGGPEPTIPPPLPLDDAERGRFLIERGAFSQAVAGLVNVADANARLVRGMALSRKQKYAEADADFFEALKAVAARDRTGCAVDVKLFGCGGGEDGGPTRGTTAACRCDERYWESLAAEARFEQAYSHFDNGDLAKAEPTLRALIERRPKHTDAHALLAEVALKRGDLDGALAAARNAVSAKADHKWSTHLVGQILFKRKRFDEAVVAYRTHIGVDPECHEGRLELGRALREVGKAREAEAEFQTSLCYHLDDVEALAGAGDAALVAGRIEAAVAHFRRAAELKPDYEAARAGLLRAEAALSDRYAHVWKYYVSWIPAAILGLAWAITAWIRRRRD